MNTREAARQVNGSKYVLPYAYGKLESLNLFYHKHTI